MNKKLQGLSTRKGVADNAAVGATLVVARLDNPYVGRKPRSVILNEVKDHPPQYRTGVGHSLRGACECPPTIPLLIFIPNGQPQANGAKP